MKHKWEIVQLLYFEVLQDLDSIFLSLDIPYIPIKGAYLLYCGLADKIDNRKMSDIDLFIRSQDFHTVVAYLKRQSKWMVTKDASANDHPFKIECVYWFYKIPISIEIQTQMDTNERYLLRSDHVFNRCLYKEKMRFMVQPEDSLLIFTCHLLSHILDYLPATMYREIEILSQQEPFSWDIFWRRSRNTGIIHFILFILLISKSPCTIPPLPASLRLFYCYILSYFFTTSLYASMPRHIRYLLLFIPFVRNPWKLAIFKGIGLVSPSIKRRFVCISNSPLPIN